MTDNVNTALNPPLVSVVMPVYNASRFLGKSIQSVIDQTYSNIELILVDDCSTDDSAQIMHDFARIDNRIRIISSGKNRGVAYARNRGIGEASGSYIALLDSDDVWMKDKIKKQVELIHKHKAEIVYCSYDFIDENDASIMRPFVVSKKTGYNQMLVKCVFSCSTILVKADLLKAHPFNPNYYHEDFVLWMELMALNAKAVGDQEVLAHYRQVSGSRSNNKGNAAKERWKIYREALGMGLFPSIAAFVMYALYAVKKYYF